MSEPTRLKAITSGVFVGAPLACAAAAASVSLAAFILMATSQDAPSLVDSPLVIGGAILLSITTYFAGLNLAKQIFTSAKAYPGSYAAAALATTAAIASSRFLV